MREEWRSLKDVVEYGDYYEVSNLGRLRNINSGKILNPTVGTTGYYCTYLCFHGNKKYYKVHRLIALAFIPQIEGKNDVNHMSGDKLDNRIVNLEWMTRSENILHSFRTGLRSREGMVRSGKAGGKASGALRAKPVSQYSLNGNLMATYPSAREASRKTGFTQAAISYQCNGVSVSKQEYYFQYA